MKPCGSFRVDFGSGDSSASKIETARGHLWSDPLSEAARQMRMSIAERAAPRGPQCRFDPIRRPSHMGPGRRRRRADAVRQALDRRLPGRWRRVLSRLPRPASRISAAERRARRRLGGQKRAVLWHQSGAGVGTAEVNVPPPAGRGKFGTACDISESKYPKAAVVPSAEDSDIRKISAPSARIPRWAV